MYPERPAKAPSRTRRLGVEHEEEQAWVAFYARVRHDATVAAEVLVQLEADPELKRDRLALYLRCKESVRNDKARQVRNKRIGQAVRRLFHVLLVRPAAALRRALQLAGHVAVECLPETAANPSLRTRRSADPVRTVRVSDAPASGDTARSASTDAGIADAGGRARAAGKAA